MRFSFNVNGFNVGDKSALFSFLEQARPTNILVSDDIHLANSIQERHPDMMVVYRKYSPAEGRQWDISSGVHQPPADYVKTLVENGLNSKVYRYVLNEPFAVGDDVNRLSVWLSDVSKRLYDREVRAVFANFGVGVFNKEDIEAERYDAYLEAMSKHRELHLMGFHEYGGILLPNGVGYWRNDEILQKTKVQFENWPSQEYITEEMAREEPEFWHLMRSYWFTQYANKKGYNLPPFLITEFGWDYLNDISHVFSILQSRYGIANGHEHLRCANALENIWRDYYPGMGFNEIFVKQLEWAEKIYPENYIGFQLFTWSVGNDLWDKVAGCDYGKNTNLHRLIASSNILNTVSTGDSGDTGETGDSEDSGDTGDTGNTGDTGDTGRVIRQRIGFNIQNGAVPNVPHFVESMKRIEPTAVTVISGYGLASQLADVLPNTMVIHRDYGIGGDQDLWNNVSPKDTLKRYQKRHHDRRVWVYLLNEPMASEEKKIKKLVKWMVDVCRLLVNDGYKVVCGNLATGAHRWEDIDAGLYDDWLRMLDELSGSVVAGYHEYTASLIQFGTNLWEVQDLLDVEKVQFKNWQKREDLPIAKVPGSRAGGYPEYWHILRGQWFNVRAKEIGLPEHQSVITECFWDRMGDISRFERNFEYNGKVSNVYTHLEDKYGVPSPWYSLKGHETYANVWAGYYPELSFDQATFQQLKWANEECYPDSVIGFTMFAWSLNSEWHIQYGHNFSEQDELISLLEAYKAQIKNGEIENNTDDRDNHVDDEDSDSDDEGKTLMTIDTLDYVRGSGKLYDVRYSWAGGGSERMQTQEEGARFFHVKNENWEELWADNNFIWRGTDTSPGGDQLYQVTQENGEYGAPWVPRYWKEGEFFRVSNITTFRNISNGNPTNKYTWTSWNKLHKVHETLSFKSGVTLSDVIEIWGYLADGLNGQAGTNFERYFYAKGYGLVAWQDPTKGFESYIQNEFEGPNLRRREISWLTLPDIGQDTIDKDDERWVRVRISSTSASTNIRQGHTTDSRIIGSVTKENMAYALFPETYVDNGIKTYYWVPLLASPSKVGNDKSDFYIQGWVRSDVVVIETMGGRPIILPRDIDYIGEEVDDTPAVKPDFSVLIAHINDLNDLLAPILESPVIEDDVTDIIREKLRDIDSEIISIEND